MALRSNYLFQRAVTMLNEKYANELAQRTMCREYVTEADEHAGLQGLTDG